MVTCEYCLKELPDRQKRTTYYFILIKPDTPIHPEGIEKHVEENHHKIKVCKKCENNIFKKERVMKK
jgi:hypothetical protein